MLSIFFVFAIHFIFPHWLEYVEIDGFILIENVFKKLVAEPIPTNFALFFRNYVQVGLTEETAKATIFLLITSLRVKSIRIQDKPFAIMYYTMMVSLGFALVENIHYGWSAYNKQLYGLPVLPEKTLMLRAVSATVAHMINGLVMGFFFALGYRHIRGGYVDQTLLNIWSKGHYKIKKVVFFILGLLAASFLHGTYDYLIDLRVTWFSMAEFLIIGLTITYIMYKDLTRINS
jgi:RsiW-degrading membrane proteinase PrsW (M82 family)